MSEGIKKYVMITATILCILVALVLCWLFKYLAWLSFLFIYLIGIINGMILVGVSNYDE